MKEPTEAQIKEFWEGYGFLWHGNVAEDRWYFQGKYYDSMLPPIDLNNLFKYAVPEAISLLVEKSQKIAPPLVISKSSAFNDLMRRWLVRNPIQFGYSNTLFWALWEVKEKSSEQG